MRSSVSLGGEVGKTLVDFGPHYWGLGAKQGNEDILVKRTECV